MTSAEPNYPDPKPFLRWIGGKTRSVSTLCELAPNDINSGTYWEPFLGAGSLFFSLTPRRAVLSDLNAALISTFIAVRDVPMVIIEYLQEYAQHNSEEHYYRVRAWYNQAQTENGAKKAATFIYLNKTCFNGIWRVNKKGEFNVPYGHKDPPALPSQEELLAVSIALRSADIRTGDFREVLKEAEAGDFVYLDPPYPPVSETAYFTHYTRHRFSRDDQRFVAEIAQSLDARGCRVLISNADIGFIRALYEDFNLVPLRVTRWVNANGKRRKVGELAIMNYEIS